MIWRFVAAAVLLSTGAACIRISESRVDPNVVAQGNLILCSTSPFAGTYADTQGQTVALFTDTTGMRSEPHGFWESARIRKVQFALCQLDSWRDLIYQSPVAAGLTYADINEVENRLDLGFSTEAWRLRGVATADSLGIPASARVIFLRVPTILEGLSP